MHDGRQVHGICDIDNCPVFNVETIHLWQALTFHRRPSFQHNQSVNTKGTSAVDRAGDQDHAKRCHPPRLLFRTAPEHPTYFQRLELISTAPGLSSDSTPETVDTCSPRLQSQSRACQAWDKELEPPSTLKKKNAQLMRDDQVSIHSLRTYTNLSYLEISVKTGFTFRQVQKTYVGPLTLQKRKPRKSLLQIPQKNALRK
ncbi:hypothetical protein NEUTE1DRAFT_109976 [Neurospora tetrasperma FGSC 2508]|uniref:Uncharacterized protein n=1 Tax=Neurospora tetrasperma (strain FGSC 2508 / ATCC MYA-4615 / P0657) TaxID=510951 RepID=F8MMB3_NEUT8|nr:uncharacterized protein NEUTE1DRAFT_109976 [Neurospora tetrasperma FGSC 2508]EGO57787.1 hypothetical protein NEUTE1DRAFT_109976 [Neurospora tetrasperma FGSC 2508]EGZ71939.1 hypothetical protein NEUTE2DRAFT_129311 [Neurospora tetrasperma FGSC 2509]